MPIVGTIGLPRQRFVDSNGKAAANGKVTTYLAGSTTLAATYKDSSGTVLNTNPIILDSRGECDLWYDSGLSYKLVPKTADNIALPVQDNVRVTVDQAAASATVALSGGVPRTLQQSYGERVTAQMLGVIADGVTDTSAALNAAMSSCATAGVPLYMHGVYMACDLVTPSNLRMIGEGNGRTIIRRPASSASNAVINASGTSGFSIEGIWFDGNKALNSSPCNVAVIFGCGAYEITGCRFYHGKSSGGYGAGLVVVGGTNTAAGTRTLIDANIFDFNDDLGLQVHDDFYYTISRNKASNNSGDGIVVGLNGSAPTGPTEEFFSISGNECGANGGSGIDVTGYTNELANPTGYAFTIGQNNLHHNGNYGLVYQSVSATITGNVICNNGSSFNNGGALLDGQRCAITGNVIANNYFYGVDGGGGFGNVFSGNVFSNNGQTTAGGCGLNLGAANGATVVGNKFVMNSGSGGGSNVQVLGIDGGGSIAAFSLASGRILIEGNSFECRNNLEYGVLIAKGEVDQCTVQNNTVFGGALDRAFKFESTGVVASGNVCYDNSGNPWPSIASASTIVIPDFGDQFYVTGTTTIDTIRTQSMADYVQKVRAVVVTAQGAGFTATPGISFSGGGGTGAAAEALVVNGRLIRINVTNGGSGYTSAPTVTISGGGGTGATASARVECFNQYGRTIRLHFGGSLTVKNGTGNLVMAAGADFAATSNKVLPLVGLFTGVWNQVGS